jgi:hypothetical protein
VVDGCDLVGCAAGGAGVQQRRRAAAHHGRQLLAQLVERLLLDRGLVGRPRRGAGHALQRRLLLRHLPRALRFRRGQLLAQRRLLGHRRARHALHLGLGGGLARGAQGQRRLGLADAAQRHGQHHLGAPPHGGARRRGGARLCQRRVLGGQLPRQRRLLRARALQRGPQLGAVVLQQRLAGGQRHVGGVRLALERVGAARRARRPPLERRLLALQPRRLGAQGLQLARQRVALPAQPARLVGVRLGLGAAQGLHLGQLRLGVGQLVHQGVGDALDLLHPPEGGAHHGGGLVQLAPQAGGVGAGEAAGGGPAAGTRARAAAAAGGLLQARLRGLHLVGAAVVLGLGGLEGVQGVAGAGELLAERQHALGALGGVLAQGGGLRQWGEERGR